MLNALGGFCITAAVVFVAGYVASLVIGHHFSTGQTFGITDFGEEDDEYESESD